MPRAFILGVSGQAGYYLSKLLLSKGYEVFGTGRRPYDPRQLAIKAENYRSVKLGPVIGRMGDIIWFLGDCSPDEVYNLCSTTLSFDSWNNAAETAEVNYVLAARALAYCERHKVRYFQAGSADVFKKDHPGALDENSPREPRSPYGVSKLAVELLTRCYRDRGVFACTGILFNMESMRRSSRFFAPKVIREALRIGKSGRSFEPITLGQLTAMRDWGLTREYVCAMHAMLQAPQPKDYVIATGDSSNCYRFVVEALKASGAIPEKETAALASPDLSGIIESTGVTNESDSIMMIADPSAIMRELGWKATTRGVSAVVRELMREEEVLAP